MQQSNFILKGKYEYQWIKIIADAMKYADSFVDIGANVGTYALTIAQAFPRKRVIAIEPYKPNYDLLMENKIKNNLNNILTLQKAVSCCNGKVKFYINPIHDGGGSIIKRSNYTTGDISINAKEYLEKHPECIPFEEVDTAKIDDLIQNTSVLKIDVEGSELDAIMSGSNILRSNKVELMIIEMLPDNFEKNLDILDSFGFECFLYGGSLPVNKDTRLPKHGSDLLCLKKNSHFYNIIGFC